ncbi:PQ-loop repeat-containing protein [Aestuariimicrobium ganziense]|uniref:PQ-loop domain-containing transporter n=1 Tax=Aestuariimicrobium ganziense TaxID=2773677 RepID=UPI0019435295|nr:PQ-loop domain-containing transporter [Aestuariimicrobium ganziense]
MSAMEIYGWFCALIGAATAFPQLFKLLRARTSAGLSLLMWQLSLSVNTAWLVHGSLFKFWNLLVPNAIMGACGALILYHISRDRQIPLLRAFLLPATIFAVLATVDLTLGTVVFGILISIPQLVGAIAQFLVLLRSRDIRGVSFPFLAYSVLVNLVWFIFGVWAADAALMLAASSLGVMTIVNCTWWFLRTKGLVGPLGSKVEPAVQPVAEPQPELVAAS